MFKYDLQEKESSLKSKGNIKSQILTVLSSRGLLCMDNLCVITILFLFSLNPRDQNALKKSTLYFWH